mmetsp:Transcript_53731/g.114685  ORF Transcript_53731/g.114685 Transcript_53731/m.114685 type:complete len:122 (+) Transcript_53731:634-999(+)
MMHLQPTLLGHVTMKITKTKQETLRKHLHLRMNLFNLLTLNSQCARTRRSHRARSWRSEQMFITNMATFKNLRESAVEGHAQKMQEMQTMKHVDDSQEATQEGDAEPEPNHKHGKGLVTTV